MSGESQPGVGVSRLGAFVAAGQQHDHRVATIASAAIKNCLSQLYDLHNSG